MTHPTSRPKQAVSYARYSTDMQDPMSISAQHRKNQDFARAQGWSTAEEILDYAISGQTHDRVGYAKLFALVQGGAIDLIVVESLDRLSRDDVDLPHLFKQTSFHRVEIHTLDRGLVTRLDIGIAGLLNPMEVEKVAQRPHRSLEEKVVKEGRSAGGRGYGYRVPVGDDGLRIKGELEIVAPEAAVVLRIFREYAEGCTPREIAADLNYDRIPAPHSGKHAKGTGGWAQNTINGSREKGNGILNNDLYVGRRVWNRHD